MVTLVDSNVLIDVITRDPTWESWSSGSLADAADAGLVLINQVVYAEVSVGFPTVEECERVIDELLVQREPIPWMAAFLAGKAFAEYRMRGGTRRSPLPDFFIGAHAAVGSMQLLTRDASRYRTYYPTLELIAPS